MLFVFFKRIEPTRHYLENHSKEVPWDRVVELILMAKQKRKKGDKIEICINGCYFLCELKERTLFVINAKRSK